MSKFSLILPLLATLTLVGCPAAGEVERLPAEMPGAITANQDAEGSVNSLSVRLLGISDREAGDQAVTYQVNDRSWTPNGSPYSGPDLRAAGGPSTRYLDPGPHKSALRFLTFEVRSPKNQEVDVWGFVPRSPRATEGHPEWSGRDTPTRVTISALGPNYYRVPIVLSPGSPSAYYLAVATGPSKVVWRSKTLPASSATQVLAKEKWGTLRLIEPPRMLGIEVSKSVLPTMTFQIEDAPEPRTEAYEIWLLDQKGRSLVSSIVTQPETVRIPEGMLPQLKKIEIVSRPYRYINFPQVAYAPDPAKWGPTYWGSEGEASIQPIANIGQLEGIIRPKGGGIGWTAYEFFAPDGRRWREYPGADYALPMFSGPGLPKNPLVALIRLNESVLAEGRLIRVGVFATQGNVPGQGIGSRLNSGPTDSISRQMSQILFTRPSGDYVQIAFSTSASAWSLAGEATPPSVPLITYTREQREQMAKGVNVGVSPLTVILRTNGTMAFFYATPGKNPSTPENHLEENRAKWQAGNEVRLMARLKSGQTIELSNNGASSLGDRDYTFYLDRNGQAVLESGQTKAKLTDIHQFVVEQRGFEDPRYVVVKLPPN